MINYQSEARVLFLINDLNVPVIDAVTLFEARYLPKRDKRAEQVGATDLGINIPVKLYSPN